MHSMTRMILSWYYVWYHNWKKVWGMLFEGSDNFNGLLTCRLLRRGGGVYGGKNGLQVEIRPLLVLVTETRMETQARNTRVQAPTEMISHVDIFAIDTRSNNNLLSNLLNRMSKQEYQNHRTTKTKNNNKVKNKNNRNKCNQLQESFSHIHLKHLKR